MCIAEASFSCSKCMTQHEKENEWQPQTVVCKKKKQNNINCVLDRQFRSKDVTKISKESITL